MSNQGQFYEFYNVACTDFPPSVQLPITKTDDFDEGHQTLGLIFSCLKSLDLFLPEISLTLVIPD